MFSFASDSNNWQVVGSIGLDPPEVEQDFDLLGCAGIGGWSPYSHGRELLVDAPSTAYVALGYNIVYEVSRTHWFDSVAISGISPQPTPGDLDGDGVVGIEDFLMLLANLGPCP
ncbi:MAG: hypothetical protein ACYS15_04515 [Planctomycetota bacterium]|jgi:hypothetical protein